MNRIRKFLAAAAIAVVAITPTSAALAANGHQVAIDATEQVAPVAVDGASLVMSEPLWTLLIGGVLPVVISFAVRNSSTARKKAILAGSAAVLASIVARKVVLPDGRWSISALTALDAAVIWIVSSGGYEVFHRKVFGDINSKLAPTFGI